MADLRVVAMDHIVLRVSDVERSLLFYSDVLGLQGERVEAYRAGQAPFPSVRISADTLIDIVAAPRGNDAARNLDHFCLVTEATDLGALAAGLRAKGVTIVAEPVRRWGAHGWATSIYIKDPDENEVELRCY